MKLSSLVDMSLVPILCKFSNSQFSIQGTTGAEGDFFVYLSMREKVVGYYLMP